MRRPLIFDGRNIIDPATARAAGFEYSGHRPAMSVDRNAWGSSR